MKHGAITFALLLSAGAAGAFAFTGCSSDPETPAVPADTGVADTGQPDTRVSPDTNPPPDTGLPLCAQPLPTGFACEDPAPKAGKTVCSDEAIDAIVAGCFGSASSQTACQAAQKKYAACNTCMITDWLIEFRWFDSANCIKKVAPTDTCAKTINCNLDCMLTVCPVDECDDTEGSGKTASSTEFGDCLSAAQAKGGTTKPKGACYDVASKDYSACATKPELGVCFPRSDEEITFFYRGACRDNADWSNVTVNKPTDAGTDASDSATDTAAADTAVADTATADTATEDTAAADTATSDTGEVDSAAADAADAD